MALTSVVAKKKPSLGAVDLPADDEHQEVPTAAEGIARESAETATTEAVSEPSPNAVESLAA